MATAYFITHRRMQYSADHTHQHVGWVKLSDGSTLSRQQVLGQMRLGYVFYTLSPSRHQARVMQYHCRRCGTVYLTTEADAWRDDNLDRLPRF